MESLREGLLTTAFNFFRKNDTSDEMGKNDFLAIAEVRPSLHQFFQSCDFLLQKRTP